MKSLVQILIAAWLLALAPMAHADRVKDLASVAAMRSNQLIGYGLVVGLQGTGDGADISFTAQSMKSMLSRLGVSLRALSLILSRAPVAARWTLKTWLPLW